MKKILIILTIIAVCFTSYIIGYNTTTTTTNLDLVKPSLDDETVVLVTTINDNMDLIDAIFDTVSLAEFAFLDGVTSNIQDQLDAAGTAYTGDTEIVVTGTVLSIGSTITRDTELGSYYLKTAIDTLGKVETIWSKDVTDSTELATYCETTQDYLKTSENSDSDDDISDDSIGDLSDVDLTDIANLKILQYNSTSEKWECETLGGGGDALTTNGLDQFAATTEAELYTVLSDVTLFLEELKDDTTPELGGDLDCNNLDLTEVKTVQFNGVYAIGNSGSTETIDWLNGAYQSITIDEACVISFSNEYVGTLNLRVTYGGSFALTFTGMTLLEEGGVEIVTTDAAGVDVLMFKNWGTADTYDMGALLDVKD